MDEDFRILPPMTFPDPDQPPVFDEVVRGEIDFHEVDLVVHRDANGEIAAFHSPLVDGAVSCRICDGGARVYIRE